jgi:MFS family permease
VALRSDRLTLVFASAGHALMHMLTAFFFVIVLTLEVDWQRPYHELIGLWTLGALLVGVCALPAGWLADRWSAPGMMVVMFIGMGLACGVCATADGPDGLLAGLAMLGAFAAIYHPVGIPWLVRNAGASGKALGINGIFGGLGVGAAGLAAGAISDAFGWRAAFVVPGLVSIATGLLMYACVRSGEISDSRRARAGGDDLNRNTLVRGFLILLFTMFALGFVYQASQSAFPKLFDQRLGEWTGAGTAGVGALITLVYGVAAVMQLVGGFLADRFPLKPVYVGSFFILTPILAAVAAAQGVPLVVAATGSVLLSTAALPAENMLLARYTPQKHQGLAFGLKFVLAFGTAPVAIWFVAKMHASSGGFAGLFAVLALLAGLAVAAAMLLPVTGQSPKAAIAGR